VGMVEVIPELLSPTGTELVLQVFDINEEMESMTLEKTEMMETLLMVMAEIALEMLKLAISELTAILHYAL